MCDDVETEQRSLRTELSQSRVAERDVQLGLEALDDGLLGARERSAAAQFVGRAKKPRRVFPRSTCGRDAAE